MTTPIFTCPVEGCHRFVVTWLGELWECAEHNESMVFKSWGWAPKLLVAEVFK